MRNKIVWTIVATFVLSPMVDADDNPAPIVRRADSVQLKNIELSEAGELVGQFVTKAGLPLVGREIQLEQRETRHAVKVSEDGTFRISGLKSGTVTFTAGKDSFACRVWKKGTAPPNSLKSLALVSSDEIVLGQLHIPTILPLPHLPIHLPFPRLALPHLPIPHLPVPHLPFAGHIGSLGLGQSVGLGILAAGGAGIAIAASQDDGGVNASL